MNRRITIIIAAILCSLTSYAQIDIPPNGFNPRAMISEEVGITSISIRYSRPGVKGREGKIWGGVVAEGFSTYNFVTGSASSPWRAGANEATVIEFEHDVQVEGRDLKAGAYALFLAMGTESVTVIFSKQTEAWGTFYYDEADDVLRVDVKPHKLDNPVEWLKYEFIDHEKNGCTIAMQWEHVSVPIKVTVDVENILRARIREEFTGIKGFLRSNKFMASYYCFENDINLEEALSWAEQAITGKPFGENTFVAYANLVTGYEKLGRTAQADSVLLEGLRITDLGNFLSHNTRLVEQSRPESAIKVMQLAEERFGDILAVNDGLAHAYSATGDYKKALDYARKALNQASNEEDKMRLRKDIQELKARKK